MCYFRAMTQNFLLKDFFDKVRTHEDDKGLWVLAADFANEMGGSTTTAVLVRSADADQVMRMKTETPAGMQLMAYLHESFIYERIMRSRRPEMRKYAEELIDAVSSRAKIQDALGAMGIRTVEVQS